VREIIRERERKEILEKRDKGRRNIKKEKCYNLFNDAC
jgi:DNA invertase Pin-like site-specific DNA recombinase